MGRDRARSLRLVPRVSPRPGGTGPPGGDRERRSIVAPTADRIERPAGARPPPPPEESSRRDSVADGGRWRPPAGVRPMTEGGRDASPAPPRRAAGAARRAQRPRLKPPLRSVGSERVIRRWNRGGTQWHIADALRWGHGHPGPERPRDEVRRVPVRAAPGARRRAQRRSGVRRGCLEHGGPLVPHRGAGVRADRSGDGRSPLPDGRPLPGLPPELRPLVQPGSAGGDPAARGAGARVPSPRVPDARVRRLLRGRGRAPDPAARGPRGEGRRGGAARRRLELGPAGHRDPRVAGVAGAARRAGHGRVRRSVRAGRARAGDPRAVGGPRDPDGAPVVAPGGGRLRDRAHAAGRGPGERFPRPAGRGPDGAGRSVPPGAGRRLRGAAAAAGGASGPGAGGPRRGPGRLRDRVAGAVVAPPRPPPDDARARRRVGPAHGRAARGGPRRARRPRRLGLARRRGRAADGGHRLLRPGRLRAAAGRAPASGADGNLTRAARLLGISRATLYRRRRLLGL